MDCGLALFLVLRRNSMLESFIKCYFPKKRMLLWKSLFGIFCLIWQNLGVPYTQKTLMLDTCITASHCCPSQSHHCAKPHIIKELNAQCLLQAVYTRIKKRLTVAKAQGSISHFQLSVPIWLISSPIHCTLRNSTHLNVTSLAGSVSTDHCLRWSGFGDVSSDHRTNCIFSFKPWPRAGHSNVFLTLLKQIHEAKDIIQLRLWFWGDPMYHCGLSFSQAIKFDLCPVEAHKHFAFLGDAVEMCSQLHWCQSRLLFLPRSFWASKKLKFDFWLFKH